MSGERGAVSILLGGAALTLAALLTGCAGGGPDGSGDGTIEEGSGGQMDVIESAVAAVIPGSRVDAGVYLNGLARQFAVTVYAPEAPTAEELRAALSVIAGAIPAEASSIEFGVRSESRDPYDLASAYAELGISSASVSESGGAVTSHDLDWFRTEFGA